MRVFVIFQFILDFQEPVKKAIAAKAKSKKQQHTTQQPPTSPSATTTSKQDPLQPTNLSQPPPPPSERADISSSVGASSSRAEATTRTEATVAHTGPQLEPLVNVWRELNYRCLRCLHVWNLPQTDEAVVALVSIGRHFTHYEISVVLLYTGSVH